MTTRSSEEVERDVEMTRNRLDQTVGALKDKMTPGQIVEELTGALKGGGSEMVSNLGGQVRRNPMAAVLIGAGVAMMMTHKDGGKSDRKSERKRLRRESADHEHRTEGYDAGSGYGSASGTDSGYARSEGAYGRPDSDYVDYEGGSDQDSRRRGLAGKARGAVAGGVSAAAGLARSATGKVASGAAGAARSTGGRVASGASGVARSTGRRVSSLASTAGERARYYEQRLEDRFSDTLEEEPLIIGALGLVVGLAVGAALPTTEAEDRWFGPFRDRALDEGKDAAQHAFREVKDVASSAIGAARAEAERQGVNPSGAATGAQGLVEKAEQVVRAGVETAKQQAQTKASGGSSL